jgi:hypothetical protein
MSETRKWYTEPESFVAIAALVVSLSALGVGVYEANLQRQHDRAEVWPHLEVELFVDESGAKLQAENTGLGPAVVESIDVSLDGKPQNNWPAVLLSLTGDSLRSYSNNTVYEHGIRPGDRVTLLGLPVASLPKPFWEKMKHIVVTICYRSVFGDRWIARDTLGTANHWSVAADCPEQVATADF